jgi:hypothetical protein
MAAHYPNGSLPHELRCPHTPAELRPLFCTDCTADEVAERYTTLKTAYYDGEPLMSDEAFDRYEKYCREKFPDDERFHSVGSEEESVTPDAQPGPF